MATLSERTKPSAPSKVGTFPSLLSFKYSAETPLAGSVSTDSMSRPFSFATARREVVRGLPYSRLSVFHFAVQSHDYYKGGALTG